MQHALKPAPLKNRATIGIISPASPQRNDDYLHRGVRYLESLGYRVKIGTNALKRYNGYLAGTDDDRLRDIETMFADPKINAIFCARGGYGSSRLLNKLNYDLIAANPKIFVGFSDITALQSAIFRKTGLITFSGAMPAVDMRDDFDSDAEQWFWQALTSPEPAGIIRQTEVIVPLHSGKARGRLYCGTLSLFASLCGTPFAPPSKGIYLFEDIGEEPYRIDRMLSQLENAGTFAKAKGMAFGQFTQIPTDRSATPQPPLTVVLQEYVERLGLPSIGNLLFGHQQKKLTLPFGAVAVLDGNAGTLSITEAGVA